MADVDVILPTLNEAEALAWLLRPDAGRFPADRRRQRVDRRFAGDRPGGRAPRWCRPTSAATAPPATPACWRRPPTWSR